MPIRIPDSLPATSALEKENIFVMTEYRAIHQDIRPLKVILLNLMPTKLTTETQILRKLSNTPLQIEVELMSLSSHNSKNVSQEHMKTFYRDFSQIKQQHYDGLIITGAPVEHLDFEDVDYWDELCEVMEWSRTNVHSTFHICWGAQAGIFYHYGITRKKLDKKISGIYSHHVVKPHSPLVRGFDDVFQAPHSRYIGISESSIESCPQLEIVATSTEAGIYIVKSVDEHRFFVFGHPEYDRETLKEEYERDCAKGLDIDVPAHYFPHNNPELPPLSTWCAHAQLLYTNWLNYYVYQTAPYDVNKAGLE